MRINRFISSKLKFPHEIAHGISCDYAAFSNTKEFSIKRKIDDLNYKIEAWELKKKDKSDKTVYEVGFFTKELDEGITNKGLAVYNQIIDEMVELVILLCKREKIDDVIIEASKFSSAEQMEEVKKIMQAAYKKNKHVFNGFSYNSSEGSSLHIEKDFVSFDEKDDKPEQFKISEYFKDGASGSLLCEYDGVDTAAALLNHLKDKSGLAEKISRKQVNQQRANLYERTLKTRFPNLNFERHGTSFILHVDSLKKNSKTANLEKIDILDEEIEKIKQKDDSALIEVRADMELIKREAKSHDENNS